MAVTGAWNRKDTPSGILPLQFSSKIYNPEHDKMMGPDMKNTDSLFRLLSMIKSGNGLGSPVYDEKYQVVEDKYDKIDTAIAVLSAPTATSMTVTTGDGALFQPGDRVYNLVTRETYQITAVVGDVITVVRDIGTVLGAPSASTVITQKLRRIGHRASHGSEAPQAKMNAPTTGYNYTSFIRTTVSMDDHAQKTRTEGITDMWSHNRRKAFFLHRRSINHALWYDVRSYQASGPDGLPQFSMGGVIQHMKFRFAFSPTTPTEKSLDQTIEKVFHKGSTTKYAFCGSHFAFMISNIAKNRVQINSQDSQSYGINITDYNIAGCTLKIVVDKEIFRGYGANSSYSVVGTQASDVAVLDLGMLDLCHFNGKGTNLFEDIYDKSTDARTDEWRTTIGLRMWPSLDNTDNTTTPNEQYQPPHALITGYDTY